jgi:hypothetical protein
VTRTVYVNKKERGETRSVSTQTAGRESLAAAPLAAEPPAASRAEARGQAAQTPAGSDASAGYFTRVDMQDFQPSGEVKIRMLTKGSVDEK